MKKVHKKTLSAYFEARMRDIAPQFSRAKIKWENDVGGTLYFKWTPKPPLSCFLILIPSDKSEDFSVQLAWSVSGSNPRELGLKAHCFDLLNPKGAFSKEDICFEIHRLWGDQGVGGFEIEHPFTGYNPAKEGQDGFMRRFNLEQALTAEIARPKVEAAVDAAMQKIGSHAVPFFAEFISQRSAVQPGAVPEAAKAARVS